MQSIHFGIVVKNIKVMKEFYQRLLGIDISFEDPESGYAEISLIHPSSIDIEPHEAIREELPTLAPITHFLRIEVESLEELVETLKTRGVSIIREIKIMPYGKAECYILDPDGNVVQLFQKI